MAFSRARGCSRRRLLLAVATLLVGLGASAASQQAGQSPASTDAREGTYLYRLLLVQAAPGRFADLIDLLRRQAAALVAGGDERPFIVRHSQGDHWDFAVIYPSGSFTDYYDAARVRRREQAAGTAGLAPRDLARHLNAVAAWQEEVFVDGPPVEAFRAHVKDAGLLHFEMMQPLPGKREALIEERRMENAFNRGRLRGETLIFTRCAGAAWDVITLAAYRNWRHYAEVENVPADAADRAARAAGFPNADGVGPFMRALISTHRDTLGPPLSLDIR